jgi:lipopolysaccharide biosynthesis protein
MKFENSITIIKESGLFDLEFYKQEYLFDDYEITDFVEHYVKYGYLADFNPNKDFVTSYYINEYREIIENGLNPFADYIINGISENRRINKEMDISMYNFLYSQNNNEREHIEYKEHQHLNLDIKLIAFYLPQYHPFSINDVAWGKGFTEWSNVSRAIPQFVGHYQPRLPSDLGFYDLRLIEVQKEQIKIAKNYGIHGFCFHYYWFDGKKVMDLPIQQFIDNKELDFPFCINWANENWTKKWDGRDNDIILEQKHSKEDDKLFLESVKDILLDDRYIKVDGKVLLMIYRPNLFPNIKQTVKTWRKYAKELGIGELYLVLTHSFEEINPNSLGFDAAVDFSPNDFSFKFEEEKVIFPEEKKINENQLFYNEKYKGLIFDYKSLLSASLEYKKPEYTKFRSLCPSWDNDARKKGNDSIIYHNASPSKYEKWLDHLLEYTNQEMKNNDEKLVFINAWNEWGEGAYLEPDRKYGYSYLEKTYNTISKYQTEIIREVNRTQNKIKRNDTAVIVHLYYVDLWEELSSKLNILNNEFDLYISLTRDITLELITKIKSMFPYVTLFIFENRGRDILPFLKISQYINYLDYKYCCKFHTKKSLHRNDGEKWREELLSSILKNQFTISRIKNLIDNGSGIVVSKDNLFKFGEWVGSNQSLLEELIEKVDKKFNKNLDNDFDFPAGSIFWYNPIIIQPLLTNINYCSFDFEDSQLDGTIAHAIERLFGYLCSLNNLNIKGI